MKQKKQLSLDSDIKLLKDRSTMALCHEPGHHGHCPDDDRSAVIQEARFVLEQFLKRNLSQNDTSPIHQHYRQLTHEVIPEETNKADNSSANLSVPSSKLQRRSLTPDYIRSDSYRAAATQGAINTDLTNNKELLTVPAHPVTRGHDRDSVSPSGVCSKDAWDSLQSSGQSSSKPSQHSPISSTADDRYSDTSDHLDSSGIIRKKKSFFKRASERLRQSFRIQHREKDRHRDGDDQDEHREKKKKKRTWRKKKSSMMDSISQKAKMSLDSKTPDSVYQIEADARLHGDVSARRIDGQNSLRSEDGLETLSSSGSYKHSKKLKISPVEDKATHDQSTWDRLLHHFRKKGKKMRRKLAKEDSFSRRSKSAEPLHPPPSPTPTRGSTLESKDNEVKVSMITSDVEITSSNAYKEKLAEVIETWRGAHKSREGLRLDGLSVHRPYEAEAAGYDEVDECLAAHQSLPDGHTHEIRSRGTSPAGQRLVNKHPVRYGRLSSRVEQDGIDEPDNSVPDSDYNSQQASGNVINKPFHECSDNEKEELFEKVAQKLAAIADNYNSTAGSPLESSLSEAEPESGPAVTVVRVASLEKKIAACLRNRGDVFSESQPLATGAIGDVLKHASYNKFKQVVSKEIGNEPGVQQLAALFHITKSAVLLAGAGGALAVQVKENALRYFEDKFAGWIVGRGGWESVIEETDLESEVD